MGFPFERIIDEWITCEKCGKPCDPDDIICWNCNATFEVKK